VFLLKQLRDVLQLQRMEVKSERHYQMRLHRRHSSHHFHYRTFHGNSYWRANYVGHRFEMPGRHYHGWGHNHKFHVGHYQEHLYPVVFKNGNYYATKNGFGYRKVVFSDGQFWWRNNRGERIVMPVLQFHGFPVVYSNGYYWGSENGRDYFAVHTSNGRYYRIPYMHLFMRLHLSHGIVYPNYYGTISDHVDPVV